MNRVLAAAARYSLPVNVLCWGRPDQAKALITRNPSTTIVIDHLGLPQPFEPPVPAQPWAELPKVLELAVYDNVRIKISGACTLSHEPFPYRDIWDPLARIFDAFGLNRCMWGTDWTRAVAFLTLQAGRRCIPFHRPIVRRREGDPNGHDAQSSLQVETYQSPDVGKHRDSALDFAQ